MVYNPEPGYTYSAKNNSYDKGINLKLYSSVAYESGSAVKSSAGIMVSINGYNSGPAQFIQLYDTGSLPADGTAPLVTFAVATVSNFSYDVGGLYGIDCSTGISVCNSLSGSMKSAGADDCWYNVAYN